WLGAGRRNGADPKRQHPAGPRHDLDRAQRPHLPAAPDAAGQADPHQMRRALALLLPIIATLALWCGGHAIAAVTADQTAQTIVHMLDYVSVDYPEFVR